MFFLGSMFAPPAAAGPTNHPDPHQDRQATGADAPSRNGRLLTLVRTLVAYGRAPRGRAATTHLRDRPRDITRHFGVVDIGEIVARITRGLLRAAALEARLVSRPIREPATLATLTAASPRQPRAAQPADGSAAAGEPRFARLRTPGDIAAEIRRRPAGAVLADICRDLGIVPSNPLWRKSSAAIISYGGNLAALLGDIFDRHGLLLIRPPATAHPAGPAPLLPSTVAARHRPTLNLGSRIIEASRTGPAHGFPAALIRPKPPDGRCLTSARSDVCI